jgi:hypothetical protein
VHKQQIDVLGMELLEALAGRTDDVDVGVVAGPYLGDEEDLLTIYSRGKYAAPDLTLAGLHLGGVNVSVSQSEGTLDGPDALLPGEPPGAQAQGGNLLSLDILILQTTSFLNRTRLP